MTLLLWQAMTPVVEDNNRKAVCREPLALLALGHLTAALSPTHALLSLGDNTVYMRGKDPCNRSRGANLEIPVLASPWVSSVHPHLGREDCVPRILIATSKSWKTRHLDHGLSVFTVRGPCSLPSAQ